MGDDSPRPNTLACTLRTFFFQHLPTLRGLSPHTIHSYRDSLVLLLRFVAAHRARVAETLDVNDLSVDAVTAFLAYLERDRHTTASTRNVRLAAIHAFVRFLAAQHPEHLESAQRLLGIPFKRTRPRPAYLEYRELAAVLAAIDRSTRDGAPGLCAPRHDVQHRGPPGSPRAASPGPPASPPYQVRLLGKGRKERLCPLWPQTARAAPGVLCRERRA